ncbi:MAG: ferritin-like domain-containing protein [Acidobacteria bacterium]|nr:ferritin-like domain-containing protein [Acidobacteriota bacterium]
MKATLCFLTSLTVLMPNLPTDQFSQSRYVIEVKALEKFNNTYFLSQEHSSNKENKTNISNSDSSVNFEVVSPNVITKPKIEKTSKATDISLLNSLLQYEYLTIVLYTNCTNTELMSDPVSKIISTHLKRHQDYKEMLINSIKKLGGKPVKINNNYDLEAVYKFFGLNTLTTEKDILTLTAKIEEYGINIYNSSILYLNSKEALKLTTAIMSMAGRHSAMLYTLAGQEFIKYPKDIFNFSKPNNKPSNKDIKTINMLFSLENRALFVYEAVIATKLLAANGWKTAAKFREIHKENISKLQSLGIKLELKNRNYDLATIAKGLGVNSISSEKDLMILLDKIEEQICRVIMSNVENLSVRSYLYTFAYISATAGQMNSIWDATLDRYKEVSYL